MLSLWASIFIRSILFHLSNFWDESADAFIADDKVNYYEMALPTISAMKDFIDYVENL